MKREQFEELAVQRLMFPAATKVTIASGVLVVTDVYHAVEGEGDTSDTLATITHMGGLAPVRWMMLRPFHTDHTITVSHNTGNILCAGNADISLDDSHDIVICVYDPALDKWCAFPGAGAVAHALLGADHSDTATDSVTRGSLIYGNSTPAWDELVIGSSGKLLRSDGTDAAWSTLYSVHQYVFAPEAAPDAAVSAGDWQGTTHVSGPSDETVKRVTFIAEVAGTGVTYTLQHATGEDADTATWGTTIHTKAVATGVKGDIVSSSFTIGTVLPAQRLLRLNLSSLTGTYNNLTVILEVWRPLQV